VLALNYEAQGYRDFLKVKPNNKTKNKSVVT
jgi:hypothetical protein